MSNKSNKRNGSNDAEGGKRQNSQQISIPVERAGKSSFARSTLHHESWARVLRHFYTKIFVKRNCKDRVFSIKIHEAKVFAMKKWAFQR